MQISITKKLAAAIGIKPLPTDESINPLFCWTANWINTFDNRKEDMIVMINHATRFTVAIYGIKRNQFKNIEAKMTAAIKNTLLAMNFNPEVVNEYMSRAGDITYTSNNDRKRTAQVNSQGINAALLIGDIVNESEGKLKFEDTFGSIISRRHINTGKSYDEAFVPAREMIQALSQLINKPIYKYRAFEVLITLDLEIYKATRRLIIPADIEFQKLHNIIQKIFNWKNYHLYDFAVFDRKNKILAQLVPDEESLSYSDSAILMIGRKLSEYFPEHKNILYTYDMGDNWEHQIELIRVIDDHNENSPYLLEAKGQTPPEDVGGVPGFIAFREIMLNPNHPHYNETKEWAPYWLPELWEWQTQARMLH